MTRKASLLTLCFVALGGAACGETSDTSATGQDGGSAGTSATEAGSSQSGAGAPSSSGRAGSMSSSGTSSSGTSSSGTTSSAGNMDAGSPATAGSSSNDGGSNDGGSNDGGASGNGGSSGVDCNCLRGAYFPVCGVDGMTHDATCGLECVPVEIACMGECPCGNPGAGGSPAGGAGGSPAGGAGTAGSGDCPEPCMPSGTTCCDGRCVNLGNDPNNCGGCGTSCGGDTPYCAGTCQAAPCDPCEAGQICCLIMAGPWFEECTEPVDGTCPVGCPECDCAAPDTPIATPSGERPIAELEVGDLVYSVAGQAVVVVPIVRVNTTAVEHHRVMHVKLVSGRTLDISANHPTAEGSRFGALKAGDSLGGVDIVSVDVIDYPYPSTYDILPDTDTGIYFAAGAAIGSTLAPAPNRCELVEALQTLD